MSGCVAVNSRKPHRGLLQWVTTERSSMSNYLILSCDGGGIRGYLSSLLLQQLNNDLGIFGTNNQNINLYAGTSTGGLIALALAYGKSIDDIVQLYKTEGPNIFNPL